MLARDNNVLPELPFFSFGNYFLNYLFWLLEVLTELPIFCFGKYILSFPFFALGITSWTNLFFFWCVEVYRTWAQTHPLRLWGQPLLRYSCDKGAWSISRTLTPSWYRSLVKNYYSARKSKNKASTCSSLPALAWLRDLHHLVHLDSLQDEDLLDYALCRSKFKFQEIWKKWKGECSFGCLRSKELEWNSFLGPPSQLINTPMKSWGFPRQKVCFLTWEEIAFEYLPVTNGNNTYWLCLSTFTFFCLFWETLPFMTYFLPKFCKPFYKIF